MRFLGAGISRIALILSGSISIPRYRTRNPRNLPLGPGVIIEGVSSRMSASFPSLLEAVVVELPF